MTRTMNECDDNATNMEILYGIVTNEMWTSWDNVADYFDYQPWVFSILGSAMVGLSGVLPLLVIPIDEGANLKHGAGARTLKLLLSFAVGGLLGDVFLHLLPEAWANRALNITSDKGHPSMVCGLWVLTGFLVFIIAEKIFIDSNESEVNADHTSENIKITKQKIKMVLNNNMHNELENNNSLSMNVKAKDAETLSTNMDVNCIKKNSYINNSVSVNSFLSNIEYNNCKELHNNGEKESVFNLTKANGLNNEQYNNCKNGQWERPIKLRKSQSMILTRQMSKESSISTRKIAVKSKHISGYLNLLANCIDNFTHGLAVGGSFLISFRLGALTTFAILIHEIPHEVGDFAILLKSGFNRYDAARAQLLTASGGIFGALIAVLCSGSGVESRTSWILPFTAGGFLHIGLVTILPELLKESNPKESMKQLGALLSGITVMAILTLICD